jgi:hypothetical protein
VYRASANLLARASGRPVLEGSDVPFLNECGWRVVLGCGGRACAVLWSFGGCVHVSVCVGVAL